MQEKGRGAIGYLMPVYTVAILILFVYTAMKIVFKKKPEEDEEDGVPLRRHPRRPKQNRVEQVNMGTGREGQQGQIQSGSCTGTANSTNTKVHKSSPSF